MPIHPTKSNQTSHRKGLLSRFKSWESNQMSPAQDSFQRSSDTGKIVKGAAIGAAAGAAAGAGLGAAAGAIQGAVDVNNVPVQHVHVDALVANGQGQPTFHDQTIGTIPGDSYDTFYGMGWGSQDVRASEPVVGADGKAVLTDHQFDFSGHGTPGPVKWTPTQVETTSLDHHDPYSVYAAPQFRTESYIAYYNSNGNPVWETRSVPTGLYNNYFSANENHQVVGNYEKPSVHFNSGVNTGGIILTDMGIGAAAGTVLGAIGGALVAKNHGQ